MTNGEIISKIASELRDVCKTTTFEFRSNDDLDKYKETIDGMLINIAEDKTITPDINKTQFPDKVILMIIENTLWCRCDGINDFSEITAVWESFPNSVGYTFNFTLSKTQERVIFNIDLGGGNQNK